MGRIGYSYFNVIAYNEQKRRQIINPRKRLEAIREVYLRVSEVMQIEAEPDIVETDYELIGMLNGAAEFLQSAWRRMIDEGYEGDDADSE